MLEVVKDYNQAVDRYTDMMEGHDNAEKFVITSILSDVQQLLSYSSPDALEMANDKINDLKRCLNQK